MRNHTARHSFPSANRIVDRSPMPAQILHKGDYVFRYAGNIADAICDIDTPDKQYLSRLKKAEMVLTVFYDESGTADTDLCVKYLCRLLNCGKYTQIKKAITGIKVRQPSQKELDRLEKKADQEVKKIEKKKKKIQELQKQLAVLNSSC